MTNKINYNARHINTDSRYTGKARAVTEMKKAKARKQRIILGTVAIALVTVIAAGAMVFGALNAPKIANTAPTTAISAKTATPALTASKATTAPRTTAVPAAQKASVEQPVVQQTSVQQPAVQQTVQTAPAEQTAQQSVQTQTPTQAPVQDRIDNINGERVYIDTKRPAPAGSGTPAHYYANGKTSYGFDWTYNADNCNFLLRCDYNFNQQQYDFQFYGVTPGTSHVTLYYNTDDNVQVPVSLTIVVDDALNVSMA